jgi:hypothetical protein
MLFCVIVIILYFTVLYYSLFHCSTLPLGINPFEVNNNKILKLIKILY